MTLRGKEQDGQVRRRRTSKKIGQSLEVTKLEITRVEVNRLMSNKEDSNNRSKNDR